MENTLATRLQCAIKSLQNLVGESVTINLNTYPCIVGMEHQEQSFESGGEKAISHVGISIRLSDILASPVAPVIGNPALLVERNRTYRITAIAPTQTTWEIELADITN